MGATSTACGGRCHAFISKTHRLTPPRRSSWETAAASVAGISARLAGGWQEFFSSAIPKLSLAEAAFPSLLPLKKHAASSQVTGVAQTPRPPRPPLQPLTNHAPSSLRSPRATALCLAQLRVIGRVIRRNSIRSTCHLLARRLRSFARAAGICPSCTQRDAGVPDASSTCNDLGRCHLDLVRNFRWDVRRLHCAIRSVRDADHGQFTAGHLLRSGLRHLGKAELIAQ